MTMALKVPSFANAIRTAVSKVINAFVGLGKTSPMKPNAKKPKIDKIRKSSINDFSRAKEAYDKEADRRYNRILDAMRKQGLSERQIRAKTHGNVMKNARVRNPPMSVSVEDIKATTKALFEGASREGFDQRAADARDALAELASLSGNKKLVKQLKALTPEQYEYLAVTTDIWDAVSKYIDTPQGRADRKYEVDATMRDGQEGYIKDLIAESQTMFPKTFTEDENVSREKLSAGWRQVLGRMLKR
jgi:hypothetical protein